MLYNCKNQLLYIFVAMSEGLSRSDGNMEKRQTAVLGVDRSPDNDRPPDTERPPDSERPPDIERPPDVSNKRPRGPSDCLSWSDSEDEPFTPFTQENPVPKEIPAKKVFAKKSAPKRVKKSVIKKSSGKASQGTISANAKGKSLGMLCHLLVFLFFLYLYCDLYHFLILVSIYSLWQSGRFWNGVKLHRQLRSS